MKRQYKIWTIEESKQLAEAVKYVIQKYGSIQWEKVADLLPGRNKQQCKSFYANNIRKLQNKRKSQQHKIQKGVPVIIRQFDRTNSINVSDLPTFQSYGICQQEIVQTDTQYEVYRIVNNRNNQETGAQDDLMILSKIKNLLHTNG